MLFVLALTAVASLHGAEPPAWLTPYLTPEAREWKKAEPVVVLTDEVTYRQLSATRTEVHETHAILVHNTEAGTSKAVATLPYTANQDKISALQAWVIPPNGKTTKVSRAKFNDLSELDPRFWYQHRTLIYKPDMVLANGTILAWESTIEAESGPLRANGWSADNLPTWHASLQVTPLPGSVITWFNHNPNLPSPTIDAATGRHTWQLSQLLPPKHGKPTGFHARWNRISLRISPDQTTSDRHATWSGLSSSIDELFGQRAALTPELQAKAKALIAGKPDRWERIRALVDFVQGQVTYLSAARENDYLAGYRPQSAADSLRLRYADCKDKATLLIALLSAIHEQAHPVLLFATNPDHVNPKCPATSFNHAIVAIDAGADAPADWPIVTDPTLGRLVIVDATAMKGMFGILPKMDQGGYALIVHPEHGNLIQLPTDKPELGGIELKGQLSLAANGDVTANIRETRLGQIAYLDHLSLENLPADKARARIEKQIQKTVSLVENFNYTTNWEANTFSLVQEIRFHAPRFGRRAGKDSLILTPSFSRELQPLNVWQTKYLGRSFLTQEQIREEIHFTLPAEATLAELPAPLQLEHGSARVDITYTQEAGALVYRSYFYQPAGLYEKADYDKLYELRQDYLKAQNRPVILKVAAAAAQTK